MTDPPTTPEVPADALVRLMNAGFDTSELAEDELVAAVGSARETKKRTESAVAAELKARGRSWREIGKLLGVDHSTAYGWVQGAPR